MIHRSQSDKDRGRDVRDEDGSYVEERGEMYHNDTPVRKRTNQNW